MKIYMVSLLHRATIKISQHLVKLWKRKSSASGTLCPAAMSLQLQDKLDRDPICGGKELL